MAVLIGILQSIPALGRLVGKSFQQGEFRVEEMIGWAEDEAASGTCRRETAAHFRTGLLRRALGEKVELVEAANHATTRIPSDGAW